MTTTTPASPPPTVRRFRRSKTDRTFQGVCGGIAEALAMDPVIVRVLMVVLAFFGGAGIIVYGACWLLMPEDDSEPSLAERVISKEGRNPWPVLLGIGALGLAVVLTAGWFIDSRGALLIALFVIGGILLARREADTRPIAPAPTSPAPTFPAPTSPAPSPAPPDDAATTAGFAVEPQTGFTETGPGTFTTAPGWEPPPTSTLPPEPPGPTGPTGPTGPAGPAGPAASAPEKPRPFLGRVTFFVVLVALGVLATVDLSGADVYASAYPAVIVGGAGLGLLLGTRWGRARWLIPLGIVGALALPPTLFLDSYDGDWVDQEHSAIAPTDVAGIAPEYQYRGGRVLLDLSAVDFTDADAHTKVRLGAGELIVTVPANVDVIADVTMGLGDVEVFDDEQGGYDVDVDRRDDGADGPGGGTLTLDVEHGFGHVEVRRAAA